MFPAGSSASVLMRGKSRPSFSLKSVYTESSLTSPHFLASLTASANSVAFYNLLRLSLLTGDTSYEKKASDVAKLYTESLTRSPATSTFFLSGLSSVFGRGKKRKAMIGRRTRGCAFFRLRLGKAALSRRTPNNADRRLHQDARKSVVAGLVCLHSFKSHPARHARRCAKSRSRSI
jgi:uncharacterized protein YyaL (SSP411 family)